MAWPRLIDTPRLCLRDPRADDAQEAFQAYASDPQVLRYLGWRPHGSVVDTRQQFNYDIHRWLKGSAWVWVLALKVPDRPAGMVIGQIELVPMSYPADQAHHVRLGYLMAGSQWGKGLMSEAVMAVLQTAFAQPAVWRVDALCDIDNPASAALLARVGMVREGEMRRAIRHPNISDVPRDVSVWALVRELSESGGSADRALGLDDRKKTNHSDQRTT